MEKLVFLWEKEKKFGNLCFFSRPSGDHDVILDIKTAPPMSLLH